METIHVKFDELMAMPSECNSLEPDSSYMIFEDPSADAYQIPSKEDFDDLFGPLYEEYFEGRNPNVSTSDNLLHLILFMTHLLQQQLSLMLMKLLTLSLLLLNKHLHNLMMLLMRDHNKKIMQILMGMNSSIRSVPQFLMKHSHLQGILIH
ncbi:hypothetical protein Tco_0955700 [Tanacetum coccineum]|uniref:Uncharacterized protein n=1 Tax=Tanacetum coccineum TaxID=301880 RepID=A0ABQ5E7Z1_9ASTR